MNTHLTPAQLEILNHCLEVVLRREKTLAECLALYPSETVWLKSQLQTALLLRSLSAPGMPEDAVKTLESRVIRQFNRNHRVPPRRMAWVTGISKWAAGFILALVIAFGGGSTTVAASANSQPGDTLYNVKRAWENVIVFVATLIERADEVWLHLAQVRFEEMQRLAAQGALASQALDEVYVALERAIILADDDTTAPLVVFMMSATSQLQLIPTTPTTQANYTRVLTILQPHFDSAGHLVLSGATSPEAQPSQLVVASATAAPLVINTPTLVPSITPTITSEAVFSPTAIISPTPTRTPTDSPTATPSVTASFTPTLTWTPLPLPGNLVSTITPNVPLPTATPFVSSPGITPTGALLFPIRPTQLAVYMTQTAIASGEVPTEEVTPP